MKHRTGRSEGLRTGQRGDSRRAQRAPPWDSPLQGQSAPLSRSVIGFSWRWEVREQETCPVPSIISFSMRNGQRREVKFLPAPEGEKRVGAGAGIRTPARPRARFAHPFHAPPPQRSQGTAACVAAVRSPADCGSVSSVRATSFPPRPRRQESVGLRAGADGEAKRTGLSCPGRGPSSVTLPAGSSSLIAAAGATVLHF